MVTPKVLYWDLELTDMDVLVSTYGLKLHNNYLSHKDIVRDYTILGGAWGWVGKKRIHSCTVSHKDVFNDEEVIRKIYKPLSECDILVGHNTDRFDLKKFNTRALFYDLPPVFPWKTVDTLKIARASLAMSSNTLDYVAKYFEIPLHKARSPDWNLIKEGSKKELKYMEKYNRIDVEVGKAVYEKLKPAHKNPPKLSEITGEVRDVNGEAVEVCHACLSPKIVKIGYRYLNRYTRKRQRFLCRDCNYKFSSKFTEKADV